MQLFRVFTGKDHVYFMCLFAGLPAILKRKGHMEGHIRFDA